MTLEEAMAAYPDGHTYGDNKPLSFVGPATNLGDSKAAKQFVMTWMDDTDGEGAINLCGSDSGTCEVADYALTVGLPGSVTEFPSVSSCAYGNVWDCTSVGSIAVPEGYRVYWYTEEDFGGIESRLDATYEINGFLDYQSLGGVTMKSLKVERADATGFAEVEGEDKTGGDGGDGSDMNATTSRG